METPEVPAKIIHIQDETHVVINKGSNKGVKIGQRYRLYRITDKVLIDPDTLQDLGKLEIALGTGKVSYVKEDWATIESDMPTPPSKVIRRSDPYWEQEEITEVPTMKKRPFDEPVNGDYAKPI